MDAGREVVQSPVIIPRGRPRDLKCGRDHSRFQVSMMPVSHAKSAPVPTIGIHAETSGVNVPLLPQYAMPSKKPKRPERTAAETAILVTSPRLSLRRINGIE